MYAGRESGALELKHLGLASLIVLTALGCASTPDKPREATSESTAEMSGESTAPAVPWREARLQYRGENAKLAEAARELGRAAGGGIVSMNGIERRRIDSLTLEDVSIGEAAMALAEKVDGAVQVTPAYHFIHPAGYEALHDLTLAGGWPKAFDEIEGDAVFRNGTPLFVVFRLLGAGFGATLVVDNAVASADSGEIVLGDVALRDMAEAALKSARVAPGSFGVRAGDDYVFVHAGNRVLPPTYCLNLEEADRAMRKALAKRVDIDLPQPPVRDGLIDIDMGAAPLGEVVDTLSRQCAIPIRIEREIARVPVNPVSLRGVTVQTALDLVIGQWLTDDVRYEVTADGGVLIRRL